MVVGLENSGVPYKSLYTDWASDAAGKLLECGKFSRVRTSDDAGEASVLVSRTSETQVRLCHLFLNAYFMTTISHRLN